MNRIFMFIIFVLCCCELNAQQTENKNTLKGYMSASTSTGELKSPTMKIHLDGGRFEKYDDKSSVLKLNKGDFIDFNFSLPETASNVKAKIQYRSEKGIMPCFVRWNNILPPEDNKVVSKPEDKYKLCSKEYELKNPQHSNQLRIFTIDDNWSFYNIKITYDYCKPSYSDEKEGVTVTLISPDPAKSIDGMDLEFKWSGTGPCEKGYVSLQYNDGSGWKVVKGAEAFDTKDEEWKDIEKGHFVLKNHGFTDMPDFKIVYTKGEYLPKKAERFYAESQKLIQGKKNDEAFKKINEALKISPDNEKYKSAKIAIQRLINPFDTQCRKAGDTTEINISGINFSFVYCPRGQFLMGSPETEEDRNEDEKQHNVELTQGFWILQNEVSQIQWKTLMNNNPSYTFNKNNNESLFPVQNVTLGDCQKFCNRFSNSIKAFKSNGLDVSLPTEAQWEYATRAGSTEAYSVETNGIHCKTGWSWDEHVPVIVTGANAWGIRGMLGNVAEWCKDGYGPYPETAVKDPKGKISEDGYVVRGGSSADKISKCRCATRDKREPDTQEKTIGFRFVVIPK